MTARLALAEAISTAHGVRMGFEGTTLDRYVACDRDFWLQPHVLGPILDAARPIVAAEVGERLRELRGQERFVFDGAPDGEPA